MSDKVFIITVREYDEAYENLEDFRTEIETAIGQGQGFPFEIIDIRGRGRRVLSSRVTRPRLVIKEGPLARLVARLFWQLPEPAHTWFGRLTHGWRVVAWVTKYDEAGEEILDFCWERWPDGEPIRRRRA